MAGKSKPGAIHLRIIEVMKRFPTGFREARYGRNWRRRVWNRETKPI
jgi:hypothetical protein